jgi:peptidylprolyl isomerase
VPTDKRQRQKQARQERLEAERRAAKRAASRRRLITGVAIAAFVFAVLALYSFLSTGDDEDGASTTTTTVVPVVTVPEGTFPTELQSTDLTVGDGAEATLGSTITVNYTGIRGSNGEQFETTYGGEPAQFTLDAGGLIEGWVQGIPGMKVGGRRQLVIPSALAYGEAGKGDIGPNENLVFVLDLVAVD